MKKGFTLVELIIVIAIVAILAGAIFVAIDPARRLHETRNARRSSDVVTILDAIRKYQVDNNGDHYSAIQSLTEGDFYVIGTQVGSCDVECANQTADPSCVDLTSIGANYLATVPQDPKTGTAAMTGYMISLESGSVSVYACDPEGEGAGGSGAPPEIKVTR